MCLFQPLRIAFLLMLLTGCSGRENRDAQRPPGKGKIIVAAAANVQFAMKALEKAAEETLGADMEVVVSSSGKLTAQIMQGAPYDLLLSADMKYPEALFDAGKAVDRPKVYAYGALVIWTVEDVALSSDPAFLLDPQIRKIAIANPQNAPYGEQAVRYFEHYGILEEVSPKLVYGESVAQTNQYILSEACEVGLTAKSVVLSPEMRDKGRWLPVDPAAYTPIAQGVVITAHGLQAHPEASRAFYDFLFSEEAKRIFRNYGYEVR